MRSASNVLVVLIVLMALLYMFLKKGTNGLRLK